MQAYVQTAPSSLLQREMVSANLIITDLYWLFGFVTLTAYPLQLIRIWRDPDGAQSISVLAWVVWSGAYAASLAYAGWVVHAVAFSVISAGNLAGSLAIVVLSLAKRRHRRH